MRANLLSEIMDGRDLLEVRAELMDLQLGVSNEISDKITEVLVLVDKEIIRNYLKQYNVPTFIGEILVEGPKFTSETFDEVLYLALENR